MDYSSSIKSAVRNELFRIGCFLLYYILLIGLGVVVLLEAYWGVLYLFDVSLKMGSIDGMVLLVITAVGICLLALMLGIYLIKPLFSFKKDSKEGRMEVSEVDCPELFAMIKEVASQTMCQMPKHVYLSSDVNACVFYNTSFWSIFFPVRKNLEIGLGLFDGTSVEEVKAVIAHEFGHFSQNSMKVGSTVYVINTVLHNLILTNDFWDKWMDEWCMLDTGIYRYFGVFTRWLTDLIKQQTERVYGFVQKGHLRLSRFMEYEADHIACQCVGTDTFVSALCKIEILANKEDLFHRMLQSLVDEKKMLPDYFAGKRIILKQLPYKELSSLMFDNKLEEPVRTYKVASRVNVEDVWASHPSLEERIVNARTVKCESASSSEVTPSWTLIPQKVSDKVSVLRTSIIRRNVAEPLSDMSDEQFKEWVAGEIKENFVDERLRPFFGGTIWKFNIDSEIEVPLESPLTEENARKIAEFIAGIEDLRLLNQVKEGRVDAKMVSVDGIVYKRKNIPFEQFKAELDVMHEKVVKIYAAIYAYVRGKCDEDEANSYHNAFIAMFYGQQIEEDLLPPLFVHRDNLWRELNRATCRDEENYAQLCAAVVDYERYLKRTISQLDLNWISHVLGDEEYVKRFKKYLDVDHNPSYKIDTDAINEMFRLVDSLANVQRMICEMVRRTICDITKNKLDSMIES